jgi:hypothetical protein
MSRKAITTMAVSLLTLVSAGCTSLYVQIIHDREKDTIPYYGRVPGIHRNPTVKLRLERKGLVRAAIANRPVGTWYVNYAGFEYQQRLREYNRTEAPIGSLPVAPGVSLFNAVDGSLEAYRMLLIGCDTLAVFINVPRLYAGGERTVCGSIRKVYKRLSSRDAARRAIRLAGREVVLRKDDSFLADVIPFYRPAGGLIPRRRYVLTAARVMEFWAPGEFEATLERANWEASRFLSPREVQRLKAAGYLRGRKAR